MTSQKGLFFQSASIFFVTLSCLVLPFATSLLSLFSTLAFLFWLLSGKIKEIPHLLKTNVIALVSILLFLLFVVGMSFTAAEISGSLDYLKKYRELVFIPIIISLLRNNPKAKINCEYAFVIGCTILLLISYAMYFSVLPSARYGNSIVYHITHSFFMAILAFWCAHKSLDSKQYRYLWMFLFAVTVFNLFYIAPGRTGMLVFFCLIILFLLQRLSLLQQLIGALLLTLLVGLVFFTSNNFASRSSLALKEIQNYEYGASRSSMGMRFDWWVNSVELIKQKPLLGHGTGSFPVVHDKFISGTKIKPTDNPHNEFLLIGVQLGFCGITLFILLFIFQLRCSYQLERSDRMFVQGVIVAMMVGCVLNSFLFDSHQGHFYTFLSAVYFSQINGCRILSNGQASSISL